MMTLVIFMFCVCFRQLFSAEEELQKRFVWLLREFPLSRSLALSLSLSHAPHLRVLFPSSLGQALVPLS
jgi:hypothetical protein